MFQGQAGNQCVTQERVLGVFPYITHPRTISPLHDRTFLLGEAVHLTTDEQPSAR